MNTEGMIEITGANLIEVAKAAYDLSSPQGLGFIHHINGPLSDEDAESMVNEGDKIPLSMDYVQGRACKLTVFNDNGKLFILDQWFDHSESQLLELIDRIAV